MTGLREPVIEWSVRSARGELDGTLEWVDPRMERDHASYRLGPPGTFVHVPYLAFLPPALVEASREATARGQPTAVEGLLLLFARPEWAIATRGELFAPHSPWPALLAKLAGALGLLPEHLPVEPAGVARMVALAPETMGARGMPEAAEHVVGAGEVPGWATRARDGTWPDQPDIVEEVYACRDAAWWSARLPAGPQAAPLRISGGALRFQPDGPDGSPCPLRADDLLVELRVPWRPDPAVRAWMRLVAPWMCVRLVLTEGAR